MRHWGWGIDFWYVSVFSHKGSQSAAIVLLFDGFRSLVGFGHSGIAENWRCIISVSSYQLIGVQLYCLSSLSASDLMVFSRSL